jgi:hypothetical protein
MDYDGQTHFLRKTKEPGEKGLLPYKVVGSVIKIKADFSYRHDFWLA